MGIHFVLLSRMLFLTCVCTVAEGGRHAAGYQRLDKPRGGRACAPYWVKARWAGTVVYHQKPLTSPVSQSVTLVCLSVYARLRPRLDRWLGCDPNPKSAVRTPKSNKHCLEPGATAPSLGGPW